MARKYDQRTIALNIELVRLFDIKTQLLHDFKLVELGIAYYEHSIRVGVAGGNEIILADTLCEVRQKLFEIRINIDDLAYIFNQENIPLIDAEAPIEEKKEPNLRIELGEAIYLELHSACTELLRECNTMGWGKSSEIHSQLSETLSLVRSGMNQFGLIADELGTVYKLDESVSPDYIRNPQKQ